MLEALEASELWTYYATMFDLSLAAEGLASTTRRTLMGHISALRSSFARMNPFSLTSGTLLAWLAREDIAPATWRSRRASLRRFYAWAKNAGHVENNPALALPIARPIDMPPAGPAPARPRGPARAAVPAAWREPLGAFDQFLLVQGRPDTTRQTRRQELARFARHQADTTPWEVTTAELLQYLACQTSLSLETRRSRRASLRSFYAWAVAAGHLEQSPAERLPTISAPRGLPRPIPDDELAAALSQAPPRTALILRLAAEAGLRRAEIAQLHTRDVRTLEGRVVLLVHGKGARERTVPIPDSLAREIGRCESGYLFTSPTPLGHLTPRTVGDLAAAALPKNRTLHSLRHRYATTAYRVSRDLFAVQRLLGHTSPAVTQRYVGLDVSELWPVVDALSQVELPRPLPISQETSPRRT